MANAVELIVTAEDFWSGRLFSGLCSTPVPSYEGFRRKIARRRKIPKKETYDREWKKDSVISGDPGDGLMNLGGGKRGAPVEREHAHRIIQL